MTFQPKSAIVLEGRYEWAQYAPHPALGALVSSYWTIRTGRGGSVIRTTPDACIDLTLRLERTPRAYIAGAQSKARTWAARARVHLVGARLLPGAASLLGVDADRLTDHWTPLETFLPRGVVAMLVHTVAGAEDVRGQVSALDAFLADRLLNHDLDARLSKAIRRVFESHGRGSIAELAHVAGAHTRTLTRLFDRCVGLSPKRFARIVRFQEALRLLPLGQRRSSAQIAAELGYADQAHFIRDARELFGATPGELVRLAGRTNV